MEKIKSYDIGQLESYSSELAGAFQPFAPNGFDEGPCEFPSFQLPVAYAAIPTAERTTPAPPAHSLPRRRTRLRIPGIVPLHHPEEDRRRHDHHRREAHRPHQVLPAQRVEQRVPGHV